MGEQGFESTPLGSDKLTPEEFLEQRSKIGEDVDGYLITRDEAAEALEVLVTENPAMYATWSADIQRQM